jgi:uncharacterized protein YegP (UPF0339 family)
MTDPYADTIVPMMRAAPYFELLPPDRTPDRTWRWRLTSGAGEILAHSEPHGTREAALAAIRLVKSGAPAAEVR